MVQKIFKTFYSNLFAVKIGFVHLETAQWEFASDRFAYVLKVSSFVQMMVPVPGC